MESQRKGSRKLWKPPSFEDFCEETQCKRIKLDDNKLEKVNEALEGVVVSQPKTIDELATHPKKIEEIRNWFHKTKQFKNPPILLITGPAGSAKTVTLKVVASSLNISIKEWINPADKIDSKTELAAVDKSDYTECRQIDKFEDFIFRASRYKSLFDDSDSKAILVEDFPNIFIWKPKSFHDFLEKYRENGKSPIVFICTDDRNLNLSNDLFPSSVKTKFNVTEIKFNPVNQSSLMKALKKVVSTCDKQCLSVDALQSIAQNSNGDLRNALSNVHILIKSSKGNNGRKATKSRGKVASGATELVSVKDNRAEFYQALGRVIYPKTIKDNCRDGGSIENRERIFVHDVTEMSSSFSDSFLMLLHENYVSTFSNLNSVADAADAFSVCDIYLRESELREYGSLISIIGVMISNTEPKREGFKPVRKSSVLHAASNDPWVKRFEYSNLYTTSRILSLDYIPYMKLLKVRSVTDEGWQMNEEDGFGEDNVEIEEFDD